MLIDFCLPAKNEEKILEINVKYLLDFLNSRKTEYSWQVVLIINGSQDNSNNIAKKLVKDYKQLKIKHLISGGKGRALKEYFLESVADLLVFMDIDLAVSLDNISALIKPLLNFEVDLVIGSRLLPDSNTNRSFWRSFVSRQYNSLSRLILRHNFSDLQCGFKAFRRDLFLPLQNYFVDNNWFFDTEFVILAFYFNYRIKEIPVDWRESRYSQRVSKIRVFIDVWSFIKNLIYFKYRLHSIKVNIRKH